MGRRGSGSGLGPAVGGDRPVKGVPPPPASGGLLVLLVRPRGQLDRDSTLTRPGPGPDGPPLGRGRHSGCDIRNLGSCYIAYTGAI